MARDDVTNFANAVEDLVWDKDISYMDAVLLYCELNDIEIELVAKLIPETIKAQIQFEAEDLNFLPKSNTARLPI